MTTDIFNVPEIMCDGCANSIKKALTRVAGVTEVTVDVSAKTVYVKHTAEVDDAAIRGALDKAGFTAS